MTVDVTYVELKNFPKYVCQIDVFGVPCLLTASYNSRKGQRLISLTSYDGDIVYLKPTFITNFDRVFLNFNMLLNELNVYATLEALTVNGVKQTSTDYLNWSNSYRLAFVSLPPIERLEGFRNLNDEEVFEEHEWVVDSVLSPLNGDYQFARYFANRIIDDENYNSFADLDLVDNLVKSFLDTDLQQYAAFTTAVEQLIGTADWVLDLVNNLIIYYEPVQFPPTPFIWRITYESTTIESDNPDEACHQYVDSLVPLAGQDTVFSYKSLDKISDSQYSCKYNWSRTLPNISSGVSGVFVNSVAVNPDYDEADETKRKTIPISVVAEKIISNSEDGGDEILQMLSQDYVNLVANSIFNSDESKRFVDLADLIDQFELNKTKSE